MAGSVEAEAALAAASAAGCFEPPGGSEFTLVDPSRNARLTIAVPREPGRALTLVDVLASYCSTEATLREVSGPDLERGRFADRLFLLSDDGTLGDVIPGLRFRRDGRPCGLEDPIDAGPVPIEIEIDRSRTGYTRNWPAFLARRWKLRAGVYGRFVASTVERACPGEAASILRLDTTERVHRFLDAIARRIHAAPYETYSRYLESSVPFRSVDQTLDRIIEGDGGNCAEKAMALYFIAHAHNIPAEIVLGGEGAAGKFPFRALRAVLDERTFDAEATRDAQRHWQHYAILCRPTAHAADDVFCDVAGSNIPFLCLIGEAASNYLDPERRQPIPVTITLEPIPLYYQRLTNRQDLPLDLYDAMEHFIDPIDLIHTLDNELGLLHTGDYWIGAIAYRGRRDRARIVGEYARFVRRAGLDPDAILAFARELRPGQHPLLDQFLTAYPVAASRINAAEPIFKRRLHSARPGSRAEFAILKIRRPI